jgi:serine/threonine protein kinase/Flp pilus assembly protein TadD
MTAELKRVKEIFLAALEIPNPAERAVSLVQACGADDDLRGQVEALLRQHEQSSGFLELPPAGLAPTGDSPPKSPALRPESVGSRIGPYKLLQGLGEGGMGAVYLAEQEQPVKRRVALKIIKAGMDSAHVIGRFEQERQALAMMDHPNIAKVLDAGATDAGRPYFVMELVKGIPITKYCDQENLTPRQRLELFIPVCQAVQHAHQKGLIHRDLKPSNVIIALYDGKPIPKVIDFGVAKATAQKLTERTMFTEVGQIVGTLEYMAPEQAELNNLDIDTRADVYSLGVILYELLTGSPPFTAKQLRSTAFTEMLRIIREVEPPRPSTKLSSSSELPAIAANRKLEPKKLTKLVHGDLDWIVMKCLEKERGRRYETANGLARDIQHYLADEPVAAGPPSAAYRLKKFLRRNKHGLVTAVVLGLMLLATVGAAAGALGWAARDRAARRAKVAEKVELALQEAQTLGDKALALVNDNPYQWQTTLAQALAAMHQAEGLAEPERDSLDPALLNRLAALKARLEVDEKDRQFVDRFEEIWLNANQFDVDKNHFDESEQPALIKELFKEHGIEFQGTTPQQAALQIRQRPAAIQQHMITALETWWFRSPVRVTKESQWLAAVVQAVHIDPLRNQLRDAVAAHEWKTVDSLVREPTIKRQPTAFLLEFAGGLPPELEATKLRLLKEIQIAHPGDFWANFDYAHALADASQQENAIGFYRATIALRPRNPAVHLNLGNALHDKGDYDGAVAAFQNALALNPRYGAAHRGLGTVRQAKGNLEGAIAEYRQGVELSPDDLMGWYYLAIGHLTAGQGDAYRRVCAETFARFGKTQNHALAARVLYTCLPTPDALDDMAQLVPLAEVAANDKSNTRLLGAALYRVGKLEAAIARLNEGQSRAWDHLFLAMAHHRLGHPEQALDFALRADDQIKNDHYHWPENAEAQQLRGEAQAVMGINLELMVRDAEIVRHRTAIATNPKDAGAYYNLGNALGRKRDFSGAAAAYRKVVELTPQDAGAYHNLGIVLAQTPDLDGAINAYRKSIELMPKDPSTYKNLEIALYKKGAFADAVAASRSAIDLDPKDPWPHYRLAQLLANCRDPKLRDPSQAVQHARKAVELAPSERNNWNTLGVAEFRAADWKGAIAALEKSSELGQGGDGFDWFFLAMAHWQLGDKDKARQWYDRSVAWMKKDASSDEDISRLRLEAAALLMVEESSKPVPMAK